MQIADNVLQVALGCYTHSAIYPAPKGSDPSPFQVRPRARAARMRRRPAAAASGAARVGGTQAWGGRRPATLRPALRPAARPGTAGGSPLDAPSRRAAAGSVLLRRRWLRCC